MSTDELMLPDEKCLVNVNLLRRTAPGNEDRGGEFIPLTKGGWPQNGLAYLLHRPGHDNYHTPGYRILQSFADIDGVPANECFVVDKEVMEKIAPDAEHLRASVITKIGGSSQFSSSQWRVMEMNPHVDLIFPKCK